MIKMMQKMTFGTLSPNIKEMMFYLRTTYQLEIRFPEPPH